MYTEQVREYTIQIGRNAAENDLLVAHASTDSLWLHLHDQPSPHGIITSPMRTIPDKSVIRRCALLIKQHSKAKHLPHVRVDYLPVSHVIRTDVLGLVQLQRPPRTINV